VFLSAERRCDWAAHLIIVGEVHRVPVANDRVELEGERLELSLGLHLHDGTGTRRERHGRRVERGSSGVERKHFAKSDDGLSVRAGEQRGVRHRGVPWKRGRQAKPMCCIHRGKTSDSRGNLAMGVN